MNIPNSIISILFLSLISIYGLYGQTCPPGDLVLSTQADIDNFSSNYPNCTSISGALTIAGTNISNLNGLSSLTSVTSLEVGPNPLLTDISGLSALTAVSMDIIFDGNPLLIDLDALIGITSISGRLHISDNSALDNLDGLSAISTANLLFVTGNPSLNTIADYCGLWTILQSLVIARVASSIVISTNGIDPTPSQIIALGAACPPEVVVATPVPTMSEWSVIMLFLLLLIVTTAGILSSKKSKATT